MEDTSMKDMSAINATLKCLFLGIGIDRVFIDLIK